MDVRTEMDREQIKDDDDLTSVSEYDRTSDDDAGSECSCSTCSTCSTCEICETGMSDYDEEYYLPIYNDEDQNSSHGYYGNTSSVHGKEVSFLSGEEKSKDLRYNVGNAKNGLRNTDQFLIEKFEKVMVLKADASHFRNGGYVNGEKSSQELLLGGNPKKKRVTFLDSSSSSDELASGEIVSISGLSDRSSSGSDPDHQPPFQNGVLLDHKEDWSQSYSKLKNGHSEGEMEREYYRLTNVLKTIDPLKLHSILKRTLKSKDPQTITALSTVLPKSKFTADTVHCVRCHKEYDPHYGTKKCVLYHPEKNVWRVSQNSHGANFKCNLCSKVFRWKGVWDYKMCYATELNRGICFEGVHTPDPEEVEYQPTGAAQCCEDKGCIVFYV